MRGLAILIAVVSLAEARAAVFAGLGVQPNRPTVCFVGDAVTTQSARVQQIQTYLLHIETAANVRFDYKGACPPPRRRSDGRDYFDYDIRVAIPGTSAQIFGMIPGVGCRKYIDPDGNYTGENDGGGSWSDFPSQKEEYRSCQYTMKLMGNGDTSGVPWLNHTLHEFGHALGLAHEHERSDVDMSLCRETGFGGGSTNWMTKYDPQSVMHYEFLPCGIAGNYGHTGLSEKDVVALHALYPEAKPVAEFLGSTVIRVNESSQLETQPTALGGLETTLFQPGVLSAVSWTGWQTGPVNLGTRPAVSIRGWIEIPLRLTLSYIGYNNQRYESQFEVRALEPVNYAKQITAPLAAQLPLM